MAAAFTIRTDSFPELQSHRRFQELKARGYDLRAVPVFRFDSVVEEPAKRYGVEVDTALVDALHGRRAERGRASAAGLRAATSVAAVRGLGRVVAGELRPRRRFARPHRGRRRRALRGLAPEEDVALPAGPPTKARIDLAASTFVPALAQINDQGATIRRIAAWSSFNEEQQDLLTASTNGVLWSARARRARSRSPTKRCFANGRGSWAGSSRSGRGSKRYARCRPTL